MGFMFTKGVHFFLHSVHTLSTSTKILFISPVNTILLVLTVFIQHNARSNHTSNSRYSSSPDTSTAKKQCKAETTPEKEADSVKALPKKGIKKKN